MIFIGVYAGYQRTAEYDIGAKRIESVKVFQYKPIICAGILFMKFRVGNLVIKEKEIGISSCFLHIFPFRKPASFNSGMKPLSF